MASNVVDGAYNPYNFLRGQRFQGSELSALLEREASKENFPHLSDEEITNLRERWGETLESFQHKYGHYSFHNRVEVLEGGDAGYTSMLDAIENATESVWLETYIFDDSDIAEIFIEALIKAKKKLGDETKHNVVLMVDGIGGRDMDVLQIKKLKDAGVTFLTFVPFLTNLFSLGALSFRDHRKILIVDGNRTGYCGSLNVMREDVDTAFPGGTGEFYDVHCKIEGPAVSDLALVFIDSLEEGGFHECAMDCRHMLEVSQKTMAESEQPSWAEDKELARHFSGKRFRYNDFALFFEDVVDMFSSYYSYFVKEVIFDEESEDAEIAERTKKLDGFFEKRNDELTTENVADHCYVQVVRSNVRSLVRRNRSIQKVIQKSIDTCSHSCYITTPYFFPPRKLLRSLRNQACNDKVELSLQLSGVSDLAPIPWDTMGQLHSVKKLLRDSVAWDARDQLKIHLSKNDMMHAKMFVGDRLFSTLGSFNFDWFSGQRNLEVGIGVFHHGFAKRLEALHKKRCEDFSYRMQNPYPKRTWERFTSWAAVNVVWLSTSAILEEGHHIDPPKRLFWRKNGGAESERFTSLRSALALS